MILMILMILSRLAIEQKSAHAYRHAQWKFNKFCERGRISQTLVIMARANNWVGRSSNCNFDEDYSDVVLGLQDHKLWKWRQALQDEVEAVS